jgi:toxin ParE1/3/4
VARYSLSPRAESDLQDIWLSIALDKPQAADGQISRIMDKIRVAAEFPMMGVARPELSETARVLIVGNYIVIYEPISSGIKIVAIVHGRRDLSEMPS